MKKSYYQILLSAFRRLTPAQRERLRWHAEQRTPICCRLDWTFYHKNGAG